MTPQRPAFRQSIIPFAAIAFASLACTSFGAAIVSHPEAPLPAPPALPNGGFELGTGADADNWLETIANPGAGAGTRVTRSNLDPQSGAFHMLLEVDGGAAPGEVFVTSELFPVTSEEKFVLSFWAKLDVANGPGLVAFHTIQFIDSDGSNGGGVKGQSGPTAFYGSLSGDYQRFMAEITPPAASTGADAAMIRFQFAGGAFAESDGRIFLDTVEILAVPEPASVALLSGAGCGLLARRRPRG